MLCQVAQRSWQVSEMRAVGELTMNGYASCSAARVSHPSAPSFVPGGLTSGRVFAAGLAIAAGVFLPARAGACGASPSPTYTISEVKTHSGASGVARDAGILVSAVPSLPSGGASVFADVQLMDGETDEVLPLQTISWDLLGGADATMALHPLAPLAPQHSYQVEVTPLDFSGEGAEASPFVASFTTSSELLEPLVFTGELGLSLRGGEVDVLECGPCGNDCSAIGKRRALLADVRLPAPGGGQGVYRGILHFSDHVPTRISERNPAGYERDEELHDVHVMQLVELEAGDALTLQQQVFEEEQSYAGCFTFVVWDPAGNVAQTSACLPSLSPEEIRGLARADDAILLSTDEEIASSQVRQGRADGRAASCNLGAGGAKAGPGWLALVIAAWLRRSRRRQPDGALPAAHASFGR